MKISQLPPTPIPLPPTPDVPLPELPKVEGCFIKLNLFVNGAKSGTVGKTRSSHIIKVIGQWCKPEYASLFTKIDVEVRFHDNANTIILELVREKNWIDSILVPFQDKDGRWLSKGNYTFTARVIDYQLIGGVGVPAVPELPQVPQEVPQIQVPQLPKEVEDIPRIIGEPPKLPEVREPERVVVPTTPELQIPEIPEVAVPTIPKLPEAAPFSLMSVHVQEVNFPPTSFEGFVAPQPVTIDITAPDVYVDEGMIMTFVMTAPVDDNLEPVDGKISISYTNRDDKIVSTTITTSEGTATLQILDLSYGTHDVNFSFNGKEIINGVEVETLESLSDKMNVNLLRRLVVIDVSLVP